MASDHPRRRRSIFSALLLLLVGGLFLVHNFGGRLPLWHLLERWWPLIFIVWGLAKLYDHFMAQHTGEVAPPTIAAGEIILVLLLFALIGGVGILEWGSNRPSRGEILFPWENPYSFTEKIPPRDVPKNAQITLRTTHGGITVNADDTPQIRVSARKTAHASSESVARSRADQVHVEVTPTDGGFLVEPQGQSGASGTVSVELDVHVPKDATVNVSTGHGNIRISSVGGNVTAEGHGGNIEIRQSGSDVAVNSNSGDVRVAGAEGNVTVSGRGTQVEISDVQGTVTLDGEFFGPLNFARLSKGLRYVSNRSDLAITQLSGRIEMASPGDMGIYDSTGNVTLTTTKRVLTLENVTGKIQIENRSGGIAVRFPQPPREPVDLTAQSGDIDVTMPAKSSFDVTARADRGDLDCDFGNLASKIDKAGGNAKLDGSIGSHGPKLQLHTTYGTIRIHKGQ